MTVCIPSLTVLCYQSLCFTLYYWRVYHIYGFMFYRIIYSTPGELLNLLLKWARSTIIIPLNVKYEISKLNILLVVTYHHKQTCHKDKRSLCCSHVAYICYMKLSLEALHSNVSQLASFKRYPMTLHVSHI